SLFFFQAEDGIRDFHVTGVQTCALPIFPAEYDGLGLTTTSSTLITEMLGRYAGSFSLTFGAHTGIGTLPIVYFGNEDQKKRFLPKLASGEWIAAYALTEPDAGSDALAAKTTAVLSDDGK